MRSPLAAFVARLRATRRVWRRGGAHLALLEATPAGGRAGRGSVDHCGPETLADAELGVITVRGWALLPSGPPARVDLFLQDVPLGSARIGIRRPDVTQATGDPLGAAAGYEHVLDAAALPVGSEGRPVRAIAIGEDGKRLELPSRPLSLHGAAIPAGDDTDPPPIPVRPRLHSAGAPGRRLLAVTHQLDLGGAQLYLVDLLRALKAASPCSCTVMSPKDGPLRADLEPLGIEVHVSGRMDLDDPAAYAGRVEELTGWIAAQHFDVALMNTALTFAGADAAGRAGLPVVWAIHESYEPRVLWSTFGEGLHRDVRRRAEAVLADAAAVVFEADATRRQYAEYVTPDRARTLPYGLDLDQVDAERDGFDRRAVRRRLGISDRAVVVLCVGTIEPRKGQLVLAQAFANVAERHPDAMLVFVGARDDSYSDALREVVAACGPAGRVEVHPISREVSTWYGVSDVLVCASDVESLPRAVLEAMAWELPVLGTAVFGLPDLIDHGRTGWLCAPRDRSALADGLDEVLAAGPDERRRVARAARAVVDERHALGPYARACAEILWGAADSAAASSAR